MYNYSPIEKLKIMNFRNIGEVEIDFTQSPIVTLVGKNEAGKTSVIKAFSACALHAEPREQKDWIRTTTKRFGVEIDLADKTQIVRIKDSDGGLNLYRIINPDGTIWDTTKLSDGLPVEVSEKMGLIAEPETGEFLHIRTYEDKMLFVVTPNSTNYKVMYNALKVEQLTKALKAGSNEVNALKSEINKNEMSIQTLDNQLRDIRVIDTENLTTLRDRLKSQLEMLEKIEKIKKLSDRISEYERQLGAIGLLDRFGVQPVDEIRASKLNSINKLLNSRREIANLSAIYNQVLTLGDIDISVVNQIGTVIEKYKGLDEKRARAGSLVELSNLAEIDETRVVRINKIEDIVRKLRELESRAEVIKLEQAEEIPEAKLNVVNKLIRMQAMVDSIETNKQELEKTNTYLEQIQDYLKQCGVAVESCPRCGEAVIFDIDKMS